MGHLSQTNKHAQTCQHLPPVKPVCKNMTETSQCANEHPKVQKSEMSLSNWHSVICHSVWHSDLASIWHLQSKIWHCFSGILSGILSDTRESACNIMAFLSDILSGILIWHSIWHSYLAFYLALYLTFYLAFLSGILIWHSHLAFFSGILIWHSIWHSI